MLEIFFKDFQTPELLLLFYGWFITPFVIKLFEKIIKKSKSVHRHSNQQVVSNLMMNEIKYIREQEKEAAIKEEFITRMDRQEKKQVKKNNNKRGRGKHHHLWLHHKPGHKKGGRTNFLRQFFYPNSLITTPITAKTIPIIQNLIVTL